MTEALDEYSEALRAERPSAELDTRLEAAIGSWAAYYRSHSMWRRPLPWVVAAASIAVITGGIALLVLGQRIAGMDARRGRRVGDASPALVAGSTVSPLSTGGQVSLFPAEGAVFRVRANLASAVMPDDEQWRAPVLGRRAHRERRHHAHHAGAAGRAYSRSAESVIQAFGDRNMSRRTRDIGRLGAGVAGVAFTLLPVAAMALGAPAGTQTAAAQTCVASSADTLSVPLGPQPEVLKGAPYSGVGTTEIVTTLADGNRITRTNTMRYFRDGLGRTRTGISSLRLGRLCRMRRRASLRLLTRWLARGTCCIRGRSMRMCSIWLRKGASAVGEFRRSFWVAVRLR